MKVIVGISGGVDSAVTALLLKQQGYDVEALFMKNWNETSADGRCSWEADVEDALLVCEKLAIPLNTIDLSADYWHNVFKSFLEDYKNGLTPNPDVLCNQEIKFKVFVEHALQLGADKIATGHYARINERDGVYRLLKSIDLNKDQSYFLCRLTQAQLAKTLFPLGSMHKPAVRRIAEENNLAVHAKKDSTGICFIGERPFKEFLSQYIPVQKGTIQDINGKLLGEHDGVYFYTLGQRRGLGVGGIKGGDATPWYVVAKDIDKNILYVAQGDDNPLLYCKGLNAIKVHWIGDAPNLLPYDCMTKTRYRQADQPSTVISLDEGTTSITFENPQKAVTPGQYLVLYHSDICLGGGVIESTSK